MGATFHFEMQLQSAGWITRFMHSLTMRHVHEVHGWSEFFPKSVLVLLWGYGSNSLRCVSSWIRSGERISRSHWIWMTKAREENRWESLGRNVVSNTPSELIANYPEYRAKLSVVTLVLQAVTCPMRSGIFQAMVLICMFSDSFLALSWSLQRNHRMNQRPLTKSTHRRKTKRTGREQMRYVNLPRN
jgi:hypothetical protein